MQQVKLTVEKHPDGWGYTIRHNQESGFKGIISNTFSWYRRKLDAQDRAKELMKEWN